MPSSYNPAADLKTGTRYRRKSDGEVMTLVARFPNIMLRSAKGPRPTSASWPNSRRYPMTDDTATPYTIYFFDCPHCGGRTEIGDQDPGPTEECADCEETIEMSTP